MGRSIRIPALSMPEAEALLRLLDAKREGGVLDGLLFRLAERMRREIGRAPKGKSRQKRAEGYMHLTYHEGLAAERRPILDSLRSRKPSKEEKREARSEIRDRCVVRSGGRCENPDCRRPATEFYPAHWDHFFGRKRAESVETSWMLCPDCDHLKTHNDPDAATWYHRFLRHLEYRPSTAAYRDARRRAVERLSFIVTRSSLPAAPRTR